ncbi:MAG: hypothetical protein N3C62_02805 [Synergistetes bacterium]|nr:hypothetical protein [Synergistota bacterium]
MKKRCIFILYGKDTIMRWINVIRREFSLSEGVSLRDYGNVL